MTLRPYAGFGQTVPDLPKPPIPGYKTQEEYNQALAAQKASIDEEMKSKHAMLAGGGVVVGLLIGFVVGKTMR